MATPSSKFDDDKVRGIMAEQEDEVVEILSQYRSMPFLRLTSLSQINERLLGQIVDELERRGVVKITSRGNILNQVVTLRDKGIASSSSA